MASEQELTIPSWICYGPGWDTGYSGKATVSVSRPSGSDKATVSVSAKITTSGGDSSSWSLYVQVGSNESVSSAFEGGTHHIPGGTYNASNDIEVSVGGEAGTLTVNVWVKINSAGAITGTTSDVKTTDPLNYDSQGIAVITSCSDMTIGSAVNIGWTAYSASFSYKFEITRGKFSEWSGVQTVSSTGKQTFTDYSVPASIASYMDAWSTSDSVTVTLYTYTGSSGSYTIIGSSSTTAKVYTTKDQAATIQSNWTLEETNTGNPFKTSTKDTGGDGTYRFVKDVSKLKLTVYAYSKYGAVPYYLSGGFNALTFSNAFFSKTDRKDSSGNYDLYKAEITFTPNNDGPAHWWWFYVHDSRKYSTPMIADSSGVFTVTSDSSGNVYMLLNVADYSTPQITNLTLNVSGTTVTVYASTSVTDVTNTSKTSLNSLTAALTRKKISTGASETFTVTNKLGVGELSSVKLREETLSDVDTESYEYTLALSDKYTSDTESKSTGIVALSFYKGGKGAAFFKEADANGLSIKGNTTILAPSTGSSICGIYENSSGNYTVIDLNDPKNTVRMTVKFRDIGGSVPELVGWDNAHGSYTFRASYNDAYIPGWKNIGSASTPVYFNGDGKPVACGNIVPTITSIAAWASKGNARRPVYFDSSGVPQACNMFTGSSDAMFHIIDEVIDVGTVYSYNYGSSYNKYKEVSKAFTNVPSGYKAIAVAGFWIQALNNGSYTYDIAYCLSVLDCCVSADQSKVWICVANAGESAQTVRATVRVLCVYTG